MKRAIGWLFVLAVLAGLGYGGWVWYESRQKPPMSYRTAPVRKMDVAQTIPATGTVVPEDVIDVGAQVNGQIAQFGIDKEGKPIDYRSEVAEGTVLAKIDDSLYAADLSSAKAQQAQAQSQVNQANAQIKTGEANKQLALAKEEQATRDWARAQKLANTTALSKADYDAAESAYEQAKATVGVADASIAEAEATKTQAEAQVQQAAAQVERAARNVAYCVINSPVGGVVIDRRVEIGQTVVASLNAPSLFLLAKDLSKMQVLVQVNEADIGSVHPGQEVTFGTDAFAGRTFVGQVRKVRLNATMTQNVVTYTVEIATDNADLKLLPYLTANVKFDVAHRNGVLAVPNAALRWAPRGMESSEPGDKPEGHSGLRAATVWVLKDGQPSEVHVRAGLTDNLNTEIEGDGVAEGLEVIVGEQIAEKPSSEGTNPFAQQMFRGNRTRPSTGSGASGTPKTPGGSGGQGTGTRGQGNGAGSGSSSGGAGGSGGTSGGGRGGR